MGREDSYLFEPTYHFVPNFFRVYLGNDGLYPQFEGVMKAWYLGVGPGSFTLNPEPTIKSWPYDKASIPDKIMSALLAN